MSRFPLGPEVPRMMRFVEAWPVVSRIEDVELRRETLARIAAFDDRDGDVILNGCDNTMFRLLWAAAALATYGTPEEIRRDLRGALRSAPVGDTAAIVEAAAAIDRRAALAEAAVQELEDEGWTFSTEKRQVQALPLGGVKGNAPRRFLTKMIELAYDDMLPSYRSRTLDITANPRALRDSIAHLLSLFFPPDSLTDDVIRSAIDNLVKRRLRN